MKRIEGILPALITPYRRDGSIHEETLRRLVEWNIEKGVDGFYVGGSTAETFLLDHAERRRLVEIVSEHLRERRALVVHVGSIRTSEAIELARHAAGNGADAVSAIPPFYYNFSMDEIKRYYFDIAESVDLPLILYNFPAFSGVILDQHTAGDLFSAEGITGIKHTSQDMYQLERMKQAAPGISVLNGHDEVFLSALSLGADGAVGSTYNFMAEKFLEMQRCFLANDMSGAVALQRSANNIIEVLKRGGVFNGIKYILELLGFECGECRKPFEPISPEQRNRIEEVIKRELGGEGAV